jgi:hypothetical protein
MNRWYGAAAGAAILFLAGCATPKLDFEETSPRISEFNPRTVVVLPFTNTMGSEAINEKANSVMTSEIAQAHLFDRVVDPAQVRQVMASDAKWLDYIVQYRTKWTATGMSDAASAKAIANAFKVDSIVFGEVTQWGTQKSDGKVYTRAGCNFRWVDANSGEVLWKASHVGETSKDDYGLGGALVNAAFGTKDDGPEKTFRAVLQYMFKAWPKEHGK